MSVFGTCPECNTEIESELGLSEVGACPKCGANYQINFDCDDEYDAITILDFYYLDHE